MAKVNAPLYALNGGEVGGEAVSRLDLERLRFAGSLYRNILPRVVGSMTIRPGLEHVMSMDIGETRFLEYAFSGTTTFLPVISDEEVRIIKDDAFITRASVSTAVTNGDFSSFTSWTDNSDGSATAGVSGGQLVLTGKAFDRASATQTLSVSGGDQNVEHGLRIKVARGPVVIRLGTSSGGDDLIASSTLDDGDHSISFTPTGGSAYLEIYNEKNRIALVDSCEIDASGTMVLEAPWADTDLTAIRQKQSIDTIYLACNTYQQREIQRRGDASWGIQRYKVDNGPFKTYSGPISLTPSVLTGNGTLTASEPYFKSTMVGRLFRLFHSGQSVDADFTGEDQQGDPVRVSGVGTARNVTRTVTGTWSGTIYFQTATDDGSGNPTGWVDSAAITSNLAQTITIPDDNVIKYVRFVIKAGDYVSGTIETNITYAGGSESGIARVTAYNSDTSVDIEVLDSFSQTTATNEWDRSMWSDMDGWPRAVEIFGGRLFWTYQDTVFGSVSDEYKSFDDTIEGDSAPIIRSLGSGGQAGALWLLGLQRLIAGTDISEVSVRSSAYDEPLTAANWFPLDASTHGSSDVRAVKVDTAGIFINGDGTSIYQLVWDANAQDYSSNDLTELHQEICDGSPVVALAVQRKPDTVVWFILENGEARALTYEPSESVIAWSRITTTGGLFKDVASIKGRTQDTVYFAVVRNGTRRLEKMAKFSECRGGAVNCLADAFKRFSVTTSQAVFDMSHLPNGTEVTVWADGVAIHDQSDPATISGGNVTLAEGVENCTVVIGLPYNGDWTSTKLAYGAQMGTALMQPKRVSQLGIYFYKTMLDGVSVGRDFDNLRKFTTTKNGGPLTAGELQETFDGNLMSFNGDWDTDSRVSVRMQAPYPCTAAAIVMQVKTNDVG